MGFKSAEEFREVMDQVFGLMSADPDMGPRLREADVPQRFEYPDMAMVVTVRPRAEVADGQNLEWAWGADVEWEYDVEMTMDSDVANGYFQGRENIAMAIARRRITTGGDVRKALAVLPMTKPVFVLYRSLLEEKYPHLSLEVHASH
ncbi:MAG: hypothetical protein QOG62_2114 [Thermoleophilaceae bacterium]|nr:hypothetical protein [Thermoleophilaceae bacterium]